MAHTEPETSLKGNRKHLKLELLSSFVTFGLEM